MEHLVELNICLAKTEDAESISLLISSVSNFFTLNPSGVGAEEFLTSISESAIRSYITSDKFSYYVCFVNSTLAGVAAMRDNTHLYHLFVSKNFQKQGVSRALWDKAMKDAISANNPDKFTVNSSLFAVPVYERFGFSVCGPKVVTNGISFVPMTLNRNSLSP